MIELVASQEIAIRRISERRKGRAIRDDETPKAIQARFNTYYANRDDIVQYFKDLHIFHKVDGEQDVEKVHKDITDVIKEGM